MSINPAPQGAPSISIKVGPRDWRCRYWAKVIRLAALLPAPSAVNGATDIPVHYLPRGDEELFVGDVLIEGEANHHRRRDRGWTYWVSYVDHEGNLIVYRSGFGTQKAAAKAQGLPAHLLAGAGDVAGAVRVAHALRAGMKLPGGFGGPSDPIPTAST